MHRHYRTFFWGGAIFNKLLPGETRQKRCRVRDALSGTARGSVSPASHIAMYVFAYCYVYIACSYYCYISSVLILLYMQAQRAAGAHCLPRRTECAEGDCGSIAGRGAHRLPRRTECGVFVHTPPTTNNKTKKLSRGINCRPDSAWHFCFGISRSN